MLKKADRGTWTSNTSQIINFLKKLVLKYQEILLITCMWSETVVYKHFSVKRHVVEKTSKQYVHLTIDFSVHAHTTISMFGLVSVTLPSPSIPITSIINFWWKYSIFLHTITCYHAKKHTLRSVCFSTTKKLIFLS